VSSFKCYWFRVYGIGIAVEKPTHVLDFDECSYRVLSGKLYFGPLMICFSVPLKRKNTLPPSH
jgi:hypothetical protein